jgi:hypothetical protein
MKTKFLWAAAAFFTVAGAFIWQHFSIKSPKTSQPTQEIQASTIDTNNLGGVVAKPTLNMPRDREPIHRSESISRDGKVIEQTEIPAEKTNVFSKLKQQP